MDRPNFSDETIKHVSDIEVGLPNNRGGDFISVYRLQNAIAFSASFVDLFPLRTGMHIGFSIVLIGEKKCAIFYEVPFSKKNFSLVKKYKGDVFKIYSKMITKALCELYSKDDESFRLNLSIVERNLSMPNLDITKFVMILHD